MSDTLAEQARTLAALTRDCAEAKTEDGALEQARLARRASRYVDKAAALLREAGI